MCNRRAFYNHWNQHHSAKFNRRGEHPAKKFWKGKFNAAFNHPPVNVEESDDQYVLYLYAPGLEKSDFLIATVDQTLSISVEKKEEEQMSWRRKEFSPGGFKRQFELNEKVDKTTISAKYENGVLEVTLPKLEGFETARQTVEIA